MELLQLYLILEGMKDQVKNNYNGFIVKKNNPQDLAKTLKKALSLFRGRVFKNVRKCGEIK